MREVSATVTLTARLLIVLSCLASCIYGVITVRRHFRPSFFNIALCGMFASFLTRLFFFVLTIADGNDRIFSVGVFGQAAVYLFYTVANRAYVPLEEAERGKREFCLPAFAAALLPCLLFFASAAADGSPGAMVGEGIYIISMGPAAYFCAKSIRNKYHNPFRRQIAPFNACVCTLIYMNAISETMTVIGGGEQTALGAVVLTVISVPVIAAMLPLLRRGLSLWEI